MGPLLLLMPHSVRGRGLAARGAASWHQKTAKGQPDSSARWSKGSQRQQQWGERATLTPACTGLAQCGWLSWWEVQGVLCWRQTSPQLDISLPAPVSPAPPGLNKHQLQHASLCVPAGGPWLFTPTTSSPGTFRMRLCPACCCSVSSSSLTQREGKCPSSRNGQLFLICTGGCKRWP